MSDFLSCLEGAQERMKNIFVTRVQCSMVAARHYPVLLGHSSLEPHDTVTEPCRQVNELFLGRRERRRVPCCLRLLQRIARYTDTCFRFSHTSSECSCSRGSRKAPTSGSLVSFAVAGETLPKKKNYDAFPL